MSKPYHYTCERCGGEFMACSRQIKRCRPCVRTNGRHALLCRMLKAHTDPDICLNWVWSRVPDGYGTLAFNGVVTKAHRVAYTEANGPIPAGLHVLHKCDNRQCINPAHLWLGTNADNVQDRENKGRNRVMHGSRNGWATLNESAIQEILRLSEDGWTQCSLARRFGTSQANIWRIIKRLAWKHVQRSPIIP